MRNNESERKARKAAYQRQWNAKNPEKLVEYAARRKASGKQKAADRRWYKNNTSKRKDYNRRTQLRIKYGITQRDYDILLKQQGGICAICGDDKAGTGKYKDTPFVIDHCHTTNMIRGLLCRTCNVGLGMFRDQVPLLNKASLYLERFNEQTRNV